MAGFGAVLDIGHVVLANAFHLFGNSRVGAQLHLHVIGKSITIGVIRHHGGTQHETRYEERRRPQPPIRPHDLSPHFTTDGRESTEGLDKTSAQMYRRLLKVL